MSTEAEIIAQGKSHYFTHKGVYNNPYGSGTTEFNAYERGWMQSLKRDNASLVDVPSNPVIVDVPIKPTENLYALQKGRSGPRSSKA